MKRSAHIALIAAGLCGQARLAEATPDYRLTPDVIVAGGYDDNLLFDNQGGDRIGRAALRLKLTAEDHTWRMAIDGSGSLYGFQIHEKLVPLGEMKGWLTSELTHTDELRGRFQAEGSDDPMTLAQLGLLGAGGSALGFKTSLEWDHRMDDPRWNLIGSVFVDGERRLETGFADDSGDVAGVGVKPRRLLSRDLAVETTVEARTFFSTTVVGNSVEALPGVYYRVARRWFAEVQVGGGGFFDSQGPVPVWIARGTMTWNGRWDAVELAASHDLAVPSDRAGVLGGELLEGAYRRETHEWQFVTRVGFYRTEASPRSGEWSPAYGVQAGIFRAVTKGVWAGITGLHYEQLPTSFQTNVTRDAFFVRFDFTSGKPL